MSTGGAQGDGSVVFTYSTRALIAQGDGSVVLAGHRGTVLLC